MIDLLEKAREEQGNISYYEIAKRLNVSDQVVRKWKNKTSKPNGLNTLKLMELANLERDEAIRIMNNEKGYMSLLIMTTIAGTALLASFLRSLECILC